MSVFLLDIWKSILFSPVHVYVIIVISLILNCDADHLSAK